jgi:hypothetical protein
MSAGSTSEAAPAALVGAILDPRTLDKLDARGWERVLSCARRNAVLAYLAEKATSSGIIDSLPENARAALLAAKVSAGRLAQLARWELDRVRRALRPAGIPIIALKGVAYILRGMPHASTRLLADIDIMVPRDRIADAERELRMAGWQGTTLDPYDQRYYREWSHEIPPLLYPGRLLEVDVHHTICPPFSRLRPDPELLWAHSVPSIDDGVRLLSPVDSVLHAVVHLFFDSDFNGRFRDLLDLHELLAAFGAGDRILVRPSRPSRRARPRPAAVLRLRNIVLCAGHSHSAAGAGRGAAVQAVAPAQRLDDTDAQCGVDARGPRAMATCSSWTPVASVRALALDANARASADPASRSQVGTACASCRCRRVICAVAAQGGRGQAASIFAFSTFAP